MASYVVTKGSLSKKTTFVYFSRGRVGLKFQNNWLRGLCIPPDNYKVDIDYQPFFVGICAFQGGWQSGHDTKEFLCLNILS